MKYKDLLFQIPRESYRYKEQSNFALNQISPIMQHRIDSEKNKIILNTNLRNGLPIENINKIAGPIIEAWASEVYLDVCSSQDTEYQLVSVQTQERLGISDIILGFQMKETAIKSNVDVKTVSLDIKSSGKDPNITSFARIRTAYVKDPNYMFIVLSLKHRVYSEKNKKTGLIDAIMEIVGFTAFDLKYISEKDIIYNPALGTGQIQIKDLLNVTEEHRTTWEFCQLLDKKYLNSSRRSIEDFYREAKRNKWLKD